jgi:hypothetical protein
VTGTKNSRWGEEEEDDATEKGTNEGIRVFYPGQACFIYKHVLMGLWSSKAQSIFLGFYTSNSTQESTYQGKRCVQKNREESRE